MFASCATRPARCVRLSPIRRYRRCTHACRFAHALQRVQPVLVVARADDVAVEFRRGIQVVVVVIQPRTRSCSVCASFSMPSVAQVSMPSARTPLTISTTLAMSASLGFAPRRAHAEAVCALCCAARAAAITHPHRASSCSRHRRNGTPIAAIAAILRTAAGLDRQQRGELHRIRVEMFACTCCARYSRSANGSLNSASTSSTLQRCGAALRLTGRTNSMFGCS